MAVSDYQVVGTNPKALFTLKVHRGEGMALLAMNWKVGKPDKDFVGFAIEYKEPKGTRFFALKNRLTFDWMDPKADPTVLQTTRSPIQKFRWVHFPRNAELRGEFRYRVTPVFMNAAREVSYGDPQEVGIALARETYPGKLNVAFTRGFVSSQAFVDRYQADGATIKQLLPARASDGLRFKPTHPKADEALAWMGFEARSAILELLDQAIADKTAAVRVVGYDLSERDVVAKLVQIGARLKIAIDDEGDHGKADSGEAQAETLLRKAGATVVRQHMGNLQHNKTIIVDGKVKKVVCGSTNFAWRGFFVQSNNAVVLTGARSVKLFSDAFDGYFDDGTVTGFGRSTAATWKALGLAGIDAQVTFSPHSAANAALAGIAEDIDQRTTSSLLYSLAFLYQTDGPIKDAIAKHTRGTKVFVYGMSDKKVGGIELQIPDGNVAPVAPAELTDASTPEPFRSEPSGGGGIRLHHKFVVIDFDKPTARVYFGSYNFSGVADRKNGENLLLIKDRRIATSYAIEALRIFDHYEFRVKQRDAKKALKRLRLREPPVKPGDKPWFDEDWTDARKKHDREIFA